jgi:microcompartment protein CcmK/EutM
VNLARVCGRVVATRRVAELGGHRLVLLQPLDDALAAQGAPLVAVDPLVGAGADAVVWYVNGVDAVDALEAREPIDAAVVGLADHVSRGGA